MSRRCAIALVCLTVAIAVYAWSSVGAQAPPPPQRVVPKWEYKVVNFDEKELNRLGDDGWEVVGMTCDIQSNSNRQGLTRVASQTQVILKRAK